MIVKAVVDYPNRGIPVSEHSGENDAWFVGDNS